MLRLYRNSLFDQLPHSLVHQLTSCLLTATTDSSILTKILTRKSVKRSYSIHVFSQQIAASQLTSVSLFGLDFLETFTKGKHFLHRLFN